jgi:hypothetical protein
VQGFSELEGFKMKKYIILGLLAPIAGLFMASCAAVVNKESVKKLPAPLQALLKPVLDQQAVIEHKFTSGTRKMLEGYAAIADAIGLKKESVELKKEAAALNANSTFTETRKAFGRTEGLRGAVQKKLGDSKGVELVSKQRFADGVRMKNDAYVIEVAMVTEATIQAVRAIQAFKKASPIEKVILTTALDPLFFSLKDMPRFLEQERKFEEACQAYAKVKGFSLPKVALATPKPAKLDF